MLAQAAFPTARTAGPFYASESKTTPYLQLGDLSTYFRAEVLNVSSIQNIERTIDAQYKHLDFSQVPEENSHSVGESWYRMAIADKKTLVLSWTYAGNRQRAYWFAARVFRGKLQTASSQAKVWQAVAPRHSKYEDWRVKGVKVEGEILNPREDSQVILYRFRLLNDVKMQLIAPQADIKH
jgi:hypothetical protein